MKTWVSHTVALALSLVLVDGPLFDVANALQRPLLSNHASAVPFDTRANNLASARASAPFLSKLLSKRPAQNSTIDSRIPGQTITTLPDGRLLKTGGLEQQGPVSTVTIEDAGAAAASVESIRLQRSRAFHSATMLPDGKVLILGGIGGDGRVADTAEIFDPETNTSELLGDLSSQSSVPNPQSAITPRVYHTATLLTEGVVLIAGGVVGNGEAVKTAELWDFRARRVVTRLKLHTPRYNHSATMLSDGNVLLYEGIDKNQPLASGELFNRTRSRFTKLDVARVQDLLSINAEPVAAHLAGSLPVDGATGVAPDALLALRFSTQLRAETVNAQTLTLNGPYGAVEVKVVPAENGMLAFVTPAAPLLPGVTYALSVDGATGQTSLSIPSAVVTFTIASLPLAGDSTGDEEDWTPDENNRHGNWRTNRPDSGWRSLKPLQAAEGITALSGQCLKLDGNPLSSVTIQISNQTAKTDQTGRFLLQDISSGHQVMIIEGRTANHGRKTYGVFKVGVDVKDRKTTVLPFTIWMPKLDMANAVTIPSPTTNDLVVSNRTIPGLELRMPAGIVVRDIEGNNVTRISMTAVPVDRPPFPLPPGVNVPVFFTVQPGGSVLIPPRAQIVYPNFTSEPAGARINFWNYDPTEKGWYVYGQGTVTEDRKQIIPDPGVVVYEFSGIMISTINRPDGPVCDCGGSDGDPVNLSTGLFVLNSTDLVLPDTLPLSITRTYRPGDSGSYSFGIGATCQFDVSLFDAMPGGQRYIEVYLILPDGGRIRYDRISPGTSFIDAVFENATAPTRFYKSHISWNGTGWDLTLKDGTVLSFPDAFNNQQYRTGLVKGIRDRYGNRLLLNRDGNTNLTRLTSLNGRWIDFTYDGSYRITQARDNSGRAVNYTYDASGRLWKVTDPAGGVTEYTYDSSHRMLTIKDARGIVYLTNQYDSNGRVIQQTQADNTTYQFAYTLDGNGKVTQTDVTDPRGNHRIATFNSSGYRLTDTKGCSCGSGVTYEREAGTNFITAVTDALGRRTQYAFDSMGNVTSVTRMAGTSEAVTTNFAYEANYQQIASVTDPLNHTTAFTYDLTGNLIRVTDPLNNQTTMAYDAAGRPISVTDPLNNTTLFTYDQGDRIGVTNPLGQTVSRFVDAMGRVLSTTNPLGQTTRFEYDALNRMTRVIDPLQGATQFSYDPNGNLLSLTDARNNVTSYAYNNMDRVSTRTDPLLHAETYQYNQNGGLTQHTDRKSQVTNYTYDSLDRLSQVTYADASSTIYTYDAVSRLTQVTDSISGTITYGYDNLDRLLSEMTLQGTVGYTYDAAGRRATTTVPGQSVVNYSYDNANRLTQIVQGSSTVTFAYDGSGRRTSLTLPNGVATEYSYDAASNLKAQTYTKSGVVLGNLTYEYNAAGTRTRVGGSFARTGLPAAVNSTSYNAANQQTAFGSQALTYDLNGNLTSDGTNTYTWNARNELASIAGSVAASFQYDAVGRRRSKTIGGLQTSFLYEGDNVVQEQSSGTANVLAAALDEFFTRSDATGTTSFIVDALGSTVALTDSAGAVQAQYTYEPFGNSSVSGAASNNPSQYTGRENDATGLYYYRARYYSPVLQRFVSEDPIEFAGGDLNLYSYVGNKPTGFVDPVGTQRSDRDRPADYEWARGQLGHSEARPLGGRSCGHRSVNPTKLASALINGANAGRLYVSGFVKIGVACGVEGLSFGSGTLPSGALLAWGLWNFRGAGAAQGRGAQQFSEAFNERWSDASAKNFVGILPSGTRFDDPLEPNICTYYNQKLTDSLSSMPDIKMSRDKMGRDRW
jgi:RHS repeat-associated protein